ncbi:hypothetical protein LCGC14_2561110 [marine sediment metagenome]|uniref:Uncharacterized protein n=1 Tax=marine sediment metagenome TaxID=412755 RepID=A0A0F9B7W4_9ZZZZ
MIAESLVTGGVVAVALGALEVAKTLANRRNGVANLPESMRDLVCESRDQGKTLARILAIIEERGRA